MVTGGAGFIGSHLCELLLEQGHNVVSIDNLITGKASNLHSIKNIANFEFRKLDVTNINSLNEVFHGIDWVFHLAALADIVPSIENPKEYFETNVIGSFNIASLALHYRVKKIIYAASSSCYGIPSTYPTPENAACEPVYPYALTKNLGEQIFIHWNRVYGLPCTSLRLFNVYGPRARTSGTYGAVFGVFLAQKLANQPFTVVGDGSQTRDFTFVTDVCQAFLAAAKSPISGEIFNVGSGKTYSVNELVNLLKGSFINIPKRPGEPDCTYADITKITKLLEWKPQVSLYDGVQIMLNNIKDWEGAPVWDRNKIDKATKSWFQYLGKSK